MVSFVVAVAVWITFGVTSLLAPAEPTGVSQSEFQIISSDMGPGDE